jgi:hypothetical protein
MNNKSPEYLSAVGGVTALAEKVNPPALEKVVPICGVKLSSD